ncbi:DUF1704 domain-containing protein, partial [Candidatus Woesearchaeota archaeon]|nr:DUF1704 domain-containing protein [Candidatus Woesearchaeota archaeon]
MSKGLPEDILHCDGVLDACARKIDSNLINPVNAEAIKRSFSGKNPIFDYSGLPYFTKVRRELKALRFPKSTEGTILKKKRSFLLNKTAMLEKVGTKKFTGFSKSIHPLPKKADIHRAEELLSQKNCVSEKKIRLMDAYREL